MSVLGARVRSALVGAVAAVLAGCVPVGVVTVGGLPSSLTEVRAFAPVVHGDMGAALNAQRGAAGLPPLIRHPSLDAAALRQAQTIARTGNLSHRAPDGSSAFDRIRGACPAARLGAENLLRGSADVAVAMESWMGSPGHRGNIVDPGVQLYGYALVGGIWVMKFASAC